MASALALRAIEITCAVTAAVRKAAYCNGGSGAPGPRGSGGWGQGGAAPSTADCGHDSRGGHQPPLQPSRDPRRIYHFPPTTTAAPELVEINWIQMLLNPTNRNRKTNRNNKIIS